MSSYLEKLDRLSPEVIASFRETGKSGAIELALQQFILQMDSVMEIKDSYRFDNVTLIAKELLARRPELKLLRTAKKRVYDAYSFFHVSDSVSNKVWDNIYADKMEDLAHMCIAKGKEETALRAFLEAHRFRTQALNRISPEDLKPPVFIISPNLKPEDFGFEKASLHNIASKYQNGKYAQLIDKLPISDSEKDRLYNDAGIDIETVEEIEND